MAHNTPYLADCRDMAVALNALKLTGFYNLIGGMMKNCTFTTNTLYQCDENIGGIYKIENTLTDIRYIGKSINIKNRWHTHLQNLKSGTHSRYELQEDWNIFGEELFAFTILEQVDDKFILELKEYEHIFKYPKRDIYNHIHKRDVFKYDTLSRLYLRGDKFKVDHRFYISDKINFVTDIVVYTSNYDSEIRYVVLPYSSESKIKQYQFKIDYYINNNIKYNLINLNDYVGDNLELIRQFNI